MLLGDAVYIAATDGDGCPWNRDQLPLGKMPVQGFLGFRILFFVAEQGHDHPAIGQVKVDVRLRQSMAVRVFLRPWLADGFNLERPAAGIALASQVVEVGLQPFVVGVLAVDGRQGEDLAGGCETGDIVDMALGVIVGQSPGKPEDFIDPPAGT